MPGQALLEKRRTAFPTSASIPGFRTSFLRCVMVGMASPSASSPPRSYGTISAAGQISMLACFVSVVDGAYLALVSLVFSTAVLSEKTIIRLNFII